ncbi:hypothetical protein GOP47_0025676 [Adiantum capillus-veneris]|uniref:Uncharacterized protein n=1 Tax=Adiantum capillus-veneris TaxID=13818 RepID=A0A9D4U137_ADICA|nr:hypothetical protein GOP47_0025676 [Adiantum capillus-veneris]
MSWAGDTFCERSKLCKVSQRRHVGLIGVKLVQQTVGCEKETLVMKQDAARLATEKDCEERRLTLQRERKDRQVIVEVQTKDCEERS